VNGGGSCSRYDVAVALCEILGREDISVEPVSSAFFPLPAPRARSEAMINYKLRLLGLDPMRPWRDALEAYVTQELMSAPVAADPAKT
jgi:dTDP-4-dehydrorhamnose reductase